jgi:hypothetical protein
MASLHESGGKRSESQGMLDARRFSASLLGSVPAERKSFCEQYRRYRQHHERPLRVAIRDRSNVRQNAKSGKSNFEDRKIESLNAEA